MEIAVANYEYLTRVKNIPIITSSRKNDPDGLFSKEIFGITNSEFVDFKRKGIIALNCKIITPAIMDQLNIFDRDIYFCCTVADGSLYGLQKEDGRIKRIPKDMMHDQEALTANYHDIGSGPMFIYKHWDDIAKRFRNRTDAVVANQMVYESLSKTKKEDAFVDYHLVPCMGTRHEEDQSAGLVSHEVNKFLVSIVDISNLIAIYKGTSTETSSDIIDLNIRMQKAVQSLYDWVIEFKMGPHGDFTKKLLEKSIDNSSRLVMLSVMYTNDDIGGSKFKTNSMGSPLEHLLLNFKEITNKFTRDILDILDSSGRLITGTRLFYSREYINELMVKLKDDTFKVTPFKLLDITGSDSDKTLNMFFKDDATGEFIERPVTYIEFFFIVASKYYAHVESKVLAATRYPVDSTTSLQFLNPVVLSLVPSLLSPKEVTFKLFEFDMEKTLSPFPTITDEIRTMIEEGHTVFDAGGRFCATTTVAYGGDHDGDTTINSPLLSNEAVAEAKQIAGSLANMFGSDGSFLRSVSRDPAQSLYSLTRNLKPNEASKDVTGSEIHRYLEGFLSKPLEERVSMNKLCEALFNPESTTSLYDTVKLDFRGFKQQMTLGRLLLNVVTFRPLIIKDKKFPLFNQLIVRKTFSEIMESLRQEVIEGRLEPSDLWYIVDSNLELCMRIAPIINSSITIDMLLPPAKFKAFKDKKVKEIEDDRIKNGKYDYELITKCENEIIDYVKEVFKDDDMYELYESQNNLSLSNDYKNMTIWQGILPDVLGGDPIISLSSLNDRPDFSQLPQQYNLAIKGAVDRGVKTQIGGYMYKLLTGALSSIMAKRGDCGATTGSIGTFKSKKEILNRYIINSNGSSTLVTTANVDKYLNKEVHYRDVSGCQEKAPHFCSTCTGIGMFEGIQKGVDRVAIGILANHPSSALMNLSMKSTHSLGVDIIKISDLNNYVYSGEGKKSNLFVNTLNDKGESCIKVTKDIKMIITKSVIEPVDIYYKTLLFGTIIEEEDSTEKHTLLLGSEVLTRPRRVEKLYASDEEELGLGEMTDMDIDKHVIFHYEAGDIFLESDITFKLSEITLKMFLLYISGKVSSLVPLDMHINILKNTFKNNASISTPDTLLKVILYTLTRNQKDFRIPARLKKDEPYNFISIQDYITTTNTMTRTFAGYGSRGVVISLGENSAAQKKDPTPQEMAFRG